MNTSTPASLRPGAEAAFGDDAGDARLAVDYPEILRSGLKGYEAWVRKLQSELDLCFPESIDKNSFYKAVLIVIEAVRTFAGRFADLARKPAGAAEPARRAELLAAWDKTVLELTRASVIVENAIDLASERDVPDVLCSALVQDCIGRGETIKEGGAIYDFIPDLQVGVANMADSLAAIKKLVYEEKQLTAGQLWSAILDDFTSEESQRVQKLLINRARGGLQRLLQRAVQGHPGRHHRPHGADDLTGSLRTSPAYP